MSILLKHDWNDCQAPWKEDHLQAAVVQMLKRRNVMFAADQSGLRTSRGQAAKAKMAGMVAGEPDLRIYLPGARTVFVEMKRGDGRLSPAQKGRLAALQALGFEAHVVKAKCPAEAVAEVEGILDACA